MTEAVLALVGGLVAALLGYLGARFTARQSAKAAETAAKVSERQVDVDEWRSIVGALRDEVGRLTSRVEALETRRETDGVLIDTLKAEVEARDVRYRTLVRFTRDVLAWIEARLPGERPPATPALVKADLEGAPP